MHDEGGGGGGFAFAILGIMAIVCFIFPAAANVVFGFVPAVTSVVVEAIDTESGAISKDGIIATPLALADAIAPLLDSVGTMARDESQAVLQATGSSLVAPPKAVALAIMRPLVNADVAEAASENHFGVPVNNELALAAAAVYDVPQLLAQATDYQVPTDQFSVPIDNAQPTYADSATVDTSSGNSFLDFLSSIWSVYVPIGIFFSILFIAGMIYLYMRTAQVKHAQHQAAHGTHHDAHAHKDEPSQNALRFKQVLDLANTNNPNDWRVAILEADIMLDELLTGQGYLGQTLSDKLKQVSKGDFATIDLAWEAHKMRNKVAHDGAGLSLNEREVRRVIGMFEQTFREFKFI